MLEPPDQTKLGKPPKSREGSTWDSLTWKHLENWAGTRSVSRGRSYQRQGRVKDLAMAEDCRLLATVMGTNRYVVSVWLSNDETSEHQLQSTCTCPVGDDGCKHAV